MKKSRGTMLMVGLLAAGASTLAIRHFSGRSGSGGPHNVLLITLDTTRADHLGCYGYAPGLTPALDSLAARGVVFDRAFSSVPMTLPSHATIMTGLQPPEHGIRVNGERRLDVRLPTLAEALREQGYQTGAFIASFTLDSGHGLDRGFDTYDDDLTTACFRDENDPLLAYRPGDVVTESALSWLEKRNPEQPFFCWVHLFDPHLPYFRHEALSGTRYQGKADYDAEIAFIDVQVGRLLAFLGKEDLTTQTLVVAVGDHGEGLGEHGEVGHGYMLYETTLRVPLIFSLPGEITEGTRVDALVSLVDLFATILDSLEVGDVDERSGRSLSAALFGQGIESVPCYGETDFPFTVYRWSPLRSLTTSRWKYIRSARTHLYDCQADPAESNNLANARRDKVVELENELGAIEGKMTLRAAEHLELSAEALRRLESLGYVASGRENLDTREVDYSSLRDIEDMIPVIEMADRMAGLRRDGQFDKHLALLREIIELTPESPQLRRDLSSALVKAGSVTEALSECQESLRLDPEHAQTWHNAGILHQMLGDYPMAVRSFWEAIRLWPDAPQPHRALSNLLRDLGDPGGAARHSDLLRNVPDEAMAQYDLGIALSKQGQLPEAVASLEEALRIAPDDSLTHYGLAAVLELNSDINGAGRHYSEALRLNPDDPRSLLGLGRVLGRQGKSMEAAECFAKILQAQPDNIVAHRNLGDTYQRLGKIKKALVEYREALRLSPGEPKVANNLAWILATHHDPKIRNGAEAIKLSELACEGTGYQDPDLLDSLAAAYAEVGRFEEAIATARKALALATSAQKLQLVEDMQGRLALYEASCSYRTAP